MQEYLSVGKILNFHGIKGEAKVGFSEGNEPLLSEAKEIYVEKKSELIRLDIDRVRFHKKVAIIKFKQINSIDEVTEYKGCFLKLPKEQLTEYLEEDEFYINDLVGLKAYDTEGTYLGDITAVFAIKTQDTLSIKGENKKEHLVPFNKEIVPEVNIEEGKVVINAIEGLLGD